MYDNGEVWVKPSADGVAGLLLFRLDFSAANVNYTLRFRHPPGNDYRAQERLRASRYQPWRSTVACNNDYMS